MPAEAVPGGNSGISKGADESFNFHSAFFICESAFSKLYCAAALIQYSNLNRSLVSEAVLIVQNTIPAAVSPL